MNNTIIHHKSENLAHTINLFVFKGAPENRDPDRQVQVLVNHGYVVGYCPERLQPLWSAYRVAHAAQDVNFDRPHLYYQDNRLVSEFRVEAGTFGKLNNIQYHVGHMVPNEVINRQFGRLAQMETFFMSNMCPQRGSLNTGAWLKLENAIRNIEDTPDKDHVWAVAGPIFGDDPDHIERPGGQSIPIPDAFYYVTIDPFRYPWDRQSNVNLVCFRFPQDAPSGSELSDFIVSLDVIQDETELTFFPGWDPLFEADLGAAAVVGDDDHDALVPPRHRILEGIQA